jgi:hypothetical protein
MGMIGRRQVMSGTPPWHYMWLLRHTRDNFFTELVAPTLPRNTPESLRGQMKKVGLAGPADFTWLSLRI